MIDYDRCLLENQVERFCLSDILADVAAPFPVNNGAGELRRAVDSVVADCSFDGDVTVGKHSTVVGCIVPSGMSVTIGEHCHLRNVTIAQSGDRGVKHITIGNGVAIKDSTLYAIDIQERSFVCDSHVAGYPGCYIGTGATVIASVVDLVSSTIGNNALIANANTRIMHSHIGDDLMLAPLRQLRPSYKESAEKHLSCNFDRVMAGDRLSFLCQADLCGSVQCILGDDVHVFYGDWVSTNLPYSHVKAYFQTLRMDSGSTLLINTEALSYRTTYSDLVANVGKGGVLVLSNALVFPENSTITIPPHTVVEI